MIRDGPLGKQPGQGLEAAWSMPTEWHGGYGCELARVGGDKRDARPHSIGTNLFMEPAVL